MNKVDGSLKSDLEELVSKLRSVSELVRDSHRKATEKASKEDVYVTEQENAVKSNIPKVSEEIASSYIYVYDEADEQG